MKITYVYLLKFSFKYNFKQNRNLGSNILNQGIIERLTNNTCITETTNYNFNIKIGRRQQQLATAKRKTTKYYTKCVLSLLYYH